MGAGEPQIRQLPRAAVDAMIPGEQLRPWARKMQLRPWEEAALPLVGLLLYAMACWRALCPCATQGCRWASLTGDQASIHR